MKGLVSTAYFGCCVMCGAATESILLALAIEKHGDEGQVLEWYRAVRGRKTITGLIIRKQPGKITRPITSAIGLLDYWRDESAHGAKEG